MNIRTTSADQPTVQSSTQNIFDALISNSYKRKKDEQIELESSIFQKTNNNCFSNVNNNNNILCNQMNTSYSREHTMNNDNSPQSSVQYIPPPSLSPFEIYPNANKSADHFTMMDISYSSLSMNYTVPMDRRIPVSNSQWTPPTASQHQFDSELLSGSEASNESSNDSSSDELSTDQNPGFAFEVVSMMSEGKSKLQWTLKSKKIENDKVSWSKQIDFKFSVTERDVAIQREIYKAMKRQLKHKKSMMHNNNGIYEEIKFFINKKQVYLDFQCKNSSFFL